MFDVTSGSALWGFTGKVIAAWLCVTVPLHEVRHGPAAIHEPHVHEVRHSGPPLERHAPFRRDFDGLSEVAFRVVIRSPASSWINCSICSAVGALWALGSRRLRASMAASPRTSSVQSGGRALVGTVALGDGGRLDLDHDLRLEEPGDAEERA